MIYAQMNFRVRVREIDAMKKEEDSHKRNTEGEMRD